MACTDSWLSKLNNDELIRIALDMQNLKLDIKNYNKLSCI